MEKLIEKIFNVPEKINPLSLYGSQDSYLKLIENELQVRLIARGNVIKILGQEAEVQRVENILTEICHLAQKNNQVSQKDLEMVLQIARLGIADKAAISEYIREDRNGQLFLKSHSGVILPKSEGQQIFLNAFKDNDILFAIGPAGTGKTYLAVAVAVNYLQNQKVRKIVLARPAVEAGESLGFLPGDFKEKIDPYLKPLYDALEDMLPKDLLKKYIDQEVIEILPLAYMRGRTLNNAFVILDEAQNSTFTQMKMFLTRLGFNSKAVVTGDITQIDLPSRKESGLVSSVHVLSNIKGIAFIYLTKNDVVRHFLVREIIDAYDRYSNSK